MNRRLAFAGLLLTIFSLMSGCKVNNGDIGLLYGVWVVTEVETDGQPYYGWQQNGYNNSFFQFQNNICFVTRTNERYDTQTQVCTWEWIKEDTKISLNFTHSDDLHPVPSPGGYMYGAPSWLLLNQPVVYDFDITWTDEKHTVWTTVNNDGVRVTYHLKKTY